MCALVLMENVMLPWSSRQNGLKATDLQETGLVIPKYTSH